jgi:hypothetical protein
MFYMCTCTIRVSLLKKLQIQDDGENKSPQAHFLK